MSAVRKVLVVDDDPMIGKSFTRVLKDKGYKVITSQNAAEALDKIRAEEFDLVYTDIKMPGMSGIELAEEIKSKQPWIPVVIITGYGTAENHRRAEACGVEGFLDKPLSPSVIEDSACITYKKPELKVVVNNITVEPHVTVSAPEHFKNVMLFFAAPFIGLMYAMLMPLVGVAMLVYLAAKSFAKTKAFNVVMLLAAPFIGLAYAVSLPFLGLGMMTWVGGKALLGYPRQN